MMFLAEWLAWAGEDRRELARRLGLTRSTITMAIQRESRPGWQYDAEALLGLPRGGMEMHPLSPQARDYRGPVLLKAAKRRLDAFAKQAAASPPGQSPDQGRAEAPSPGPISAAPAKTKGRRHA
jgi:hypothetical protein